MRRDREPSGVGGDAKARALFFTCSPPNLKALFISLGARGAEVCSQMYRVFVTTSSLSFLSSQM
jgi:hypothetical protein